jgi:hypothetical protein
MYVFRFSQQFYSQILMRLESSSQVFKNAQISYFMKISLVGVELFHAEGRADMKKLIVAFRNFSKAPKHEIRN